MYLLYLQAVMDKFGKKSSQIYSKFLVTYFKFEIRISNPALAGLVSDFACLRRSGYAQAGASNLEFDLP
jgi:hypothetical protein